MKSITLLIVFLYITNLLFAQGPASWSKSENYTHPSLVVDVSTSITYISVQDVDSANNIEITNTTYWVSLDSLVPESTPEGTEDLTTPDVSELDNLVVPTDDGTSGSGTDDPDLPNAGSTDVVLGGISTTGYISGNGGRLSAGFAITGGDMTVLTTGKGAKEYLSTSILQDTLNDPKME